MILFYHKEVKFYDKLSYIGIRPIIDGRRFGVRESLEEKTMQMLRWPRS